MIIATSVILAVVLIMLSLLYVRSHVYSRELSSAIWTGDAEKIDSLLEKPGDANSFDYFTSVASLMGGYPETPLMVACGQNDFDTIKRLVEEKKVNINKNNRRASPLTTAIAGGKLVPYERMLEISNYLIDYGADVFFVDTYGDGVSVYHQLVGRRSIWNIDGSINSDLEEKEYELFLRIVEQGVPLNKEFSSGHSILSYAVRGERLEIVKYLVEEANLDVNEANVMGMTPLMHASSYVVPSTSCAEYLLSKGADKTIRDNRGKTAFDYAMEKNHTELISLLQE